MTPAQRKAAEAACRERLARKPDDTEALYALALLIKPENPDQARQLLDRCLTIAPAQIAARFERANLHRRSQQHPQAAADYLALLRHDAQHFRAWANLGNTLRDLGRPRGALRCYARALRYGGPLPVVLLNQAITLHHLQRSDEALALLRQVQAASPALAEAVIEEARILADKGDKQTAIQRLTHLLDSQPTLASALNSRGNLYAALFRYREALADFNAAIANDPGLYEALNNRANLYRNTGRFTDALADYERALSLRPGSAQVLINRGNVLRDVDRHFDALDSLQQAITIDPRFPEAYLHAGRIYADFGRLPEAIRAYQQAIEVKPDFWEAWFYKGGALRELGRHPEAIDCFRKILEADSDDINLASLGNYLFSLNFDPRASAEDYLTQARLYGDIVARRVTRRYQHPPLQQVPDILNVGLVSGDLKHHPVGFFLRNVLPHIDRSRIRLFAYHNNGEHDSVSDQLRAACHAWRVVPGLNDAQLAKQIYDDGIHVLIDLSGHTDKSRLPVFAWKPAPVQVSWLGYCASTGVKEMDYIIGDSIVTPLEDQPAFVEKIWQLPESYFCFSPPTESIPVSPLPALSNGYITFGCFNKLSKMTDAVLAVWSTILHQVPRSKLMLKTDVLADKATRANTLERFAAQGIPAERLVLEGPSSYEDYLSAYAKVDIALDPFPYPGATTTLEGLWMGVPCITMRGSRFLARNGATIAHHMGLQEFIAADEAAYVQLAVMRASDISALAQLRNSLRDRAIRSSLFDGRRFANEWTVCLRRMGMGS